MPLLFTNITDPNVISKSQPLHEAFRLLNRGQHSKRLLIVVGCSFQVVLGREYVSDICRTLRDIDCSSKGSILDLVECGGRFLEKRERPSSTFRTIRLI